jgi:hypothetical protein
MVARGFSLLGATNMQAASTLTAQCGREIPRKLDCPNPLILRRYMAEHGASLIEAQQAFDATAQFLYTSAVVPGRHALSQPIDDMWHTFILFTRDYREFCTLHFGRFIDHEPTEESGGFADYNHTRASAAALFGALDQRMWPALGTASCQGRPVPCSPPGQCNPKCNPTCHPVPLR